MKRFMCLLLAFCLLFCFSVPAYAYTADDLANKLYSGWSTTSTPLSGSWYALVKSYLSNIGANLDLYLPYLKNLGSSTDSDNSYTLVGTSKFLHNILGNNLNGTISNQLYNIRTLLTSISNNNNAWTSLQASTVTDNTSSISSVVSSISDKLIHLEPIYNNSVTIDSNVSAIKTDVNSLFSGWASSQNPNFYNNKTPTSWFGVVGLKVTELSNSLVKSKLNVTTMDDSNFGNSIWYKGVYGCLYRLQQVLADDSDLQMRQDTEENRDVFHNLFLNHSNSESAVKPDQIVSVSKLSVDLQTNFSTEVDPINLFNFLKDDNPFLWFTKYCKDSMISVPSSNSRRAPASSSPYGNYADERMQDYYNRLEGVKK